MLKRQDILLFFSLLGFAFLLLVLLPGGGEPALCEISVGGVVVDRFSLPSDMDYSLEPYGVRAHLTVRGIMVRMDSSDCPDTLCVKMGEKSHDGESIICLPNRVVIRLLGGDAPPVDIVAG